ncbi:MAG: hypothetical protein ACSLFQ_08910 [Thermoanaerobaculia bacterium]
MNIDEMRNTLAAHDHALDRLVHLNLATVRELRVTKTKSSLRWLTSGIAIELGVVSLAVIWLGSFIADHVAEARFAVPALIIAVCAVALAASCIRQLATIDGLDYSRPIVEVQKELEKLRILRIRTTKWTFILGCVLWAPILAVLVRGMIGVDPYTIGAAIQSSHADFFRWIVANVLFGIGLALLVVWISRRYAPRLSGSPFVQGLMNDIAGRSLTTAQQSLESIRQFEQE